MKTSQQKSLAAILAGITMVDPRWDRSITGIKTDSRLVQAGDLFIARSGAQSDARDYINDAIKSGASAVVAQSSQSKDSQIESEVPIFFVENLPQEIGKIAARFYDHPSRQMKVIGVTGTNGKTSCCHFLAKALDSDNSPTAQLGTLGFGRPGQLTPLIHTTPQADELQAILASLHTDGINNLAMEVSSHALDQGRVNQLEFDIAVFTNLTRDHLDYHGNMQNYGAAKAKLFQQFGLRHAVINIDDPFSQQLLASLPDNVKAWTYSVNDPSADVVITGKEFQDDLTKVNIRTPWGEGSFTTKLIGEFNLSNLLAVISCLNLSEINFAESLRRIETCAPVPGRMQTIKLTNKPLVIIDFAHTPDALKNALQAARERCQGKLWCVFGCGGGRDTGKRSLMARAVEDGADCIVVTSDNPREEPMEAIIKDVVSGFKNTKPNYINADRRTAIKYAIKTADKQDIILIAGKGHENYQEIQGVRYPFNDAEVVLDIIDG